MITTVTIAALAALPASLSVLPAATITVAVSVQGKTAKPARWRPLVPFLRYNLCPLSGAKVEHIHIL